MCRGESANDNTRPGAVFVSYSTHDIDGFDRDRGIYRARDQFVYLRSHPRCEHTNTHTHTQEHVATNDNDYRRREQ